MPDAQLQATRPPRPKGQVTSQHAGALHSHEFQTRADVDFVRGQLGRILTLADAGLLTEGREASADLLFEFQPLIVARSDLLSHTLDVLERCGAAALRQRLLVAVRGGAAVVPAMGTQA
jgi:hypothetical protein